MKILTALFLIYVCCCSNTHCEIQFDYYWRAYMGKIPSDAVNGSMDVNNRTTYIGQVYLNLGLIPVTIYPGERTVTANILGIHKLDNYIKILCSGSKGNFKWIPANARNLHVTMISKHLVRGGVDRDMPTNIGRILFDGEVKVAKVCSYNVGNAELFFPVNDREESASEYEVLVYEPQIADSNSLNNVELN